MSMSMDMRNGDEYIYNNQADAIRDARVKAGLSQKEVAEEFEIQVANYQKYEYGSRTPKPQLLDKIAHILNIDVEVLWCTENVKDTFLKNY